MNHEFFSLTEDEYIVKLGKDTFTISRLKELIAIQFEEHIMNYGDFFNLTFSPAKHDAFCFDMRNVLLMFPLEGMSGYLLPLGSKDWISGQVRIQANLNSDPETLNQNFSVEIQFAADEPRLMNLFHYPSDFQEEPNSNHKLSSCHLVHQS
ncbi:hypothetical protein PCC9214_04126 [Planktothrix tepida]|uniref:KGK family protein n=1 Tax=Planktothrix tepida PCC 9214 TaxID=671072 RepID=A0A1J1LP00_9CYAN|nr:KGK domain-containing protein [Planktothrix tepida]CAD5975444.1 hypothetical protein PCC9214_04126 [Planktothrix tepida]CUR34280.1 conserved hypothetical protein [Planktothrix tepida PCC 9214]